jgi:hypothetical protein
MAQKRSVDSSPTPKPKRVDWTRGQALVVLRFYFAAPFGKLDEKNPQVIALANLIGRTPAAVAMKASKSGGRTAINASRLAVTAFKLRRSGTTKPGAPAPGTRSANSKPRQG